MTFTACEQVCTNTLTHVEPETTKKRVTFKL